ncbi:MAG: hypothetical protein Q8R60_14420 [Mycobacteriales bacterium]|nr:hypothetical protein [Mycobacteriales bacterium]
MTEPRRSWRLRALAVLAALELTAGVTGAVVLHEDAALPGLASDRARSVPDDDPEAVRTAAVERLLGDRAQAIRRRDRAAFVATLDPDPSAAPFRKRQAKVFDALADVPIGSWSYALDPTRERVPDARVDALRGPGWWAPDVVLRYQLKGYDPSPTRAEQYFTFVQRAGRWLVASDDDFKAVGQASTPGIWDGGDVVVVRGARCLVLGHPASARTLRQVADAVDAAVPRVTAVFGSDWTRKVVVLVPDSSAELAELLDSRSDFSQIAAVATAELESSADYKPIGDRVIVNPPNFTKLGSLGRRVVLTHEVAHVATRKASGPLMPTWLVEGFADYVGYQGVDLPLSVSARELRAAVRAGRVPKALPTDRDFDATNKELSEVYEQAWLAVLRLAEVHGRAKLLAFYRDVGAAREGDRDAIVEAAFRKAFGRSTADFVEDWTATLRLRLR